MHLPMYSNGNFVPSPGNGPQQNHDSCGALPPPPPPLPVQQAYMYPLHVSSVPRAQLSTTQSYTNPSYIYPSSQGETDRGRSQQFHSYPLPVSMLPPPPPLLPPGTLPPGQVLSNLFHPHPSFPLSVPLRSLEPPGMPLPPPPPRPSTQLVADSACENPGALNGVVLDHEGTAFEDVGSSKECSVQCDESSPLLEKAKHASPLCSDPDIEMEDDITLPENESHPSGSDQVHGAYLNTEQLTPPHISAETIVVTGNELPGSKSYAQLQQDTDDGSRQSSSSPYSRKAKIVTVSGIGDMYDPFLDSFEPTSVKLDQVQEHEPDNISYIVPKTSISSNRPLDVEENNLDVDKQALSESDTTARISVSSNKPPDVEENITGNDIGAIVSVDIDELGENAESGRECNSHTTGTPNSHNENLEGRNNVREGDNTRKKSRENPKEKDSSRSKKLFQAMLTKFVKEHLKPSWKQGNMSKEAFKTIVKRVVEKVSNSMEGRRIPKSKDKIDRYIDSSRHKLTKLVMGYVNKYVKA